MEPDLEVPGAMAEVQRASDQELERRTDGCTCSHLRSGHGSLTTTAAAEQHPFEIRDGLIGISKQNKAPVGLWFAGSLWCLLICITCLREGMLEHSSQTAQGNPFFACHLVTLNALP